MEKNYRVQAKELMSSYLALMAENAGFELSADNEIEIDELVDCIIRAAADEALARVSALTAKHEDGNIILEPVKKDNELGDVDKLLQRAFNAPSVHQQQAGALLALAQMQLISMRKSRLHSRELEEIHDMLAAAECSHYPSDAERLIQLAMAKMKLIQMQ